MSISATSWAEKISDDSNSAVVYSYFRVGDDDRNTPGISASDFQEQIKEILNKDNQYNILSLNAILSAQETGSPLPPKTISFTFEGSDSSFLRNVFPLLTENKIPFTLFISPGLIDKAEKTGDPTILTWDNLKKIKDSKLATIGISSYAYNHIDGKTVDMLTSDINHARERFRAELQSEPSYFSYPFGEASLEYQDIIAKQGFKASFGQQSGVISSSSSRAYLPRFTVVDSFSDLERFKMTALALPFPVTDVEPTTSIVKTNPPHPGFTVGNEISDSDLAKMKCFASGIDKLDVVKMGKRHFEIRFSNPFEDSKGRLNCTIPAAPLDGTDDIRWRWLGFMFAVPDGI